MRPVVRHRGVSTTPCTFGRQRNTGSADEPLKKIVDIFKRFSPLIIADKEDARKDILIN